MANGKKRALQILKILKTHYPDVKTQLTHRNAFELLMATILSAQCTDRQVNAVTPALFKRFPDPASMAHSSLRQMEAIIRPTGFYHNKARHLKQCSQVLLEKFAGQVPASLEKLVTLPGVGRKTANVVLGAAFGVPGMVVDTHVARISRRLNLTKNTDPIKIEYDLMALMPAEEWNDLSLRLIYFGRALCKARNPLCNDCFLYAQCPYPDKTGGPPQRHDTPRYKQR